MTEATPTEPSFGTSVRDAVLVARFELVRAIRTWQALAVVVLYLVATAGAARIFVAVIGALENSLAKELGVPTTDYPGALMAQLVGTSQFHELVAAMVGDDRLAESVLHWPVLAIFHLWIGIALVPFLAATTSAECVSVDLRSRALRFEVLRTGRLELVVGRFLGQALLAMVASFLAVLATFAVGELFMVGNDPVSLFSALMLLTLRAWTFALPFLGLGAACSQLTASPAWARVLAVVATALSWVGFGVARWAEAKGHVVWLADVALQLLPQGWILGLWEPGTGWLASAVVFAALGLAATGAGYLRFARRDL